MISGMRSDLKNVAATPTAWVLLAASMVMAVVSLVANMSTFETSELAETGSIAVAMHASTVATMTFALIAALVSATSDYRFGRIDQQLLSQPRAHSVFSPKAAVGTVVGLVYGLAGGATAVVAVKVLYSVQDVPLELGQRAVVEPVLGVVVASALFALFGIGAGSAIRNQPFAVVGGLVLLLVIQPPLLLGLPEVGKWLPGAAGLALTVSPDESLVAPLTGGFVLAAWAGVASLVGVVRLRSARAGHAT